MQPSRLLLPWLAVVTGVIGSPQIDPPSTKTPETSWWWPSSAEPTTSTSSSWPALPENAYAPAGEGSFHNTAPNPEYGTTTDWFHGFTTAPTPASSLADDWSVPLTGKSVQPTWPPLQTTTQRVQPTWPALETTTQSVHPTIPPLETTTQSWQFFTTTPKPATSIAWQEKASNPSSEPPYKLPSTYNIPSSNELSEENYKIPPISTKNISDDSPKDKLVEIKKEQPSTIPDHNETSAQEDDEVHNDHKISSQFYPTAHDDKSSTQPKSREIDGGVEEDDDPSHTKTLDQHGPKPVPTSSTERPSNIKAGERKAITNGVGRSPWSSMPPVEPSKPGPNIIDTNPDDILSSSTAKPSSSNSPSQDSGVGRAISRSSVNPSNVPGIYEMTKTTSDFVPLETLGPPRARSGSPDMPVEKVYVENDPTSEEFDGPDDNENPSLEDEVFVDDERVNPPAEEHHHHHNPHIHKTDGHHRHTHMRHAHHHHQPKATEHHNTNNLQAPPTVIASDVQPEQNMYSVNNNNQYNMDTSIPTNSMLYNNMPFIPFDYNPPIYPNLIPGPLEFLYQVTETI